MGDFREGWAVMMELLGTDGAIFGNTNYLSRRAHDNWLEYCIATGRPQLALRWLREFEKPALSHVLRAFERDPAWRITVGRVWAEARDWPAARRELDAARTLLESPGAKMSSTDELIRQRLVLAETSLSLKQGLSEQPRMSWSAALADLADPAALPVGQGYLWPWMRGLVGIGAGSAPGAVEELSEAVRRAEIDVGSSHPDYARIHIALALTRARLSDGVPDRLAAASLRKADTTLRAVLPSSHPLMGYLGVLGGPLLNDDAAIRASARAASAPIPDLLVP
jgi:hypothetical protein